MFSPAALRGAQQTTNHQLMPWSALPLPKGVPGIHYQYQIISYQGVKLPLPKKGFSVTGTKYSAKEKTHASSRRQRKKKHGHHVVARQKNEHSKPATVREASVGVVTRAQGSTLTMLAFFSHRPAPMWPSCRLSMLPIGTSPLDASSYFVFP